VTVAVLCAGAGRHGQRVYWGAWMTLLPEDDADTGHHHLLSRRTGEPAHLRSF
jgi:hypothetical protein